MDKDQEHPLDWYEDDLEEYMPEIPNQKDKQFHKNALEI